MYCGEKKNETNAGENLVSSSDNFGFQSSNSPSSINLTCITALQIDPLLEHGDGIESAYDIKKIFFENNAQPQQPHGHAPQLHHLALQRQSKTGHWVNRNLNGRDLQSR